MEKIAVRRAKSEERSLSNEARSVQRKKETILTVGSLQATLMHPQSLMHVACVLGIIFQQTRNEIPLRFVRSLSFNQRDLRRNFSVNLVGIYIKSDSSAPCALKGDDSASKYVSSVVHNGSGDVI